MKILIFILYSLTCVYSLNSANYCSNEKKECTSHYDANQNYITECSSSNCTGQYNYKCLFDQCALNKLACDKLKIRNHLIKSFTNSDILYSQLERMRKFKQTFKPCPKQQVNVFNSSQLCSNQNMCTFKYIYILKGGIKREKTVKRSCECTGKFDYDCTGYCTIHETACNTWNSVNKTNFNQNDCQYKTKSFEKIIKLHF